MLDHVRFLRRFVAAPRTVGAVAPSSAALATEIVRQARVASARTIVELGGGTGSFTRRITEVARRDAVIVSIEINEAFAEMLSRRFERVQVIAGSAERAGDYLRAAGRSSSDCVVSGLPWAAFDAGLQSRLLMTIAGILADGGIFATFAYLHASKLPAALRFRDQLHAMFSTVRESSVVWRNIPPAFVYGCQLESGRPGRSR
jgi:phosphatidylethanolamine/phosphatidyl-N-methylethanolamine N-methyltransferase